MKVLAISGSERKNGNTAKLIGVVFDQLKAQGIECELIELAHKKMVGCQACMKCYKKKDGHCVVKNDIINDLIDKMVEADGIILGSPVYFANLSVTMKCVIERTGMVARANENLFRRKVGAAVVSVRRGGATNTMDAINKFFFISSMIVPGTSYWNFAQGMMPGDAMKDDEGVATMKELGENMAFTLKSIEMYNKAKIEETQKKVEEETVEEETVEEEEN